MWINTLHWTLLVNLTVSPQGILAGSTWRGRCLCTPWVPSQWYLVQRGWVNGSQPRRFPTPACRPPHPRDSWQCLEALTGGAGFATSVRGQRPEIRLNILQCSEGGGVSAQACPTLCDPMDCSPPGSSVHGISQARILEWIAICSSRGIFRPRVRICVSCIS